MKNRQAEREAQARAWMKENGVWRDVALWDRVTAADLADLLAATERAVWEEVDRNAILCAETEGYSNAMLEHMKWLRQRAQEVEGG